MSEAKRSKAMSDEPKCPTCGLVMCEQFDEKTIPDKRSPYFPRVYMIPNGKYICYHCEDKKR